MSLPACQPVGKGQKQNPSPRLNFAAGQAVGGCGLRPNTMGSYRIRPIPRSAVFCSCVIIVLVDMSVFSVIFKLQQTINDQTKKTVKLASV